jgi:hypothetical protein
MGMTQAPIVGSEFKKPSTAIAVADDSAYQADTNESLPQAATVEAALAVTQAIVRKESLLTLPTVPEMLNAGMTNPTVMTVHELAPFVIAGCTHLRNYMPYIITFLQKCESLPRDSKHRWLVPVEDCYSIREFFVNKCHRTPQAVYEQIRKYEKVEQARLTGTPLPKKPPTRKPSVTNDMKDGVPTKEAVAAAVAEAKEAIFENGRAAERMLQEKQALEAKANGRRDSVDVLSALELADTFARNIAEAVNASGTVNDAKAVKAARKAAVEYCKLRRISFRKDGEQK